MKHGLISLAIVLAAFDVVSAVDDGPVTVPAPRPGARGTAPPEARYNEGLAQAKRRDWKAAEAAYRDALRGRAAFPEAWNGLGYVLRHQGRYEESVRAYQEALRLKPDYPAALEYLGEAYVKMGRIDDARALLEKLRTLDAPEATDLARAIDGTNNPTPAPASRW
jgi:tetratricopeptide (TPR) repeat protein